MAGQGGESSNSFQIKAKNRGFEGFSQKNEGEWLGPFFFIQAADTQFGMIDSYVNGVPLDKVSWEAEIELTRKAIKAANNMKPKPKFFIVCGDLVDAMPDDKNKPLQERDLKKVFEELDSDIPLVCLCGNHDIGNTPTRKSVEHYQKTFGDDYFSFWVGGVKFIVINSQYYKDASQVQELKEMQDKWLDKELDLAKGSNCKHLVIFQHIPWFLEKNDEPDQYFNIDSEVRHQMMIKFKAAGVSKIFCGHYHRNTGGFYEDIELVVTSAIGAQLGKEKSGMRIVTVKESNIQHKYHELDNVPSVIDFNA